MKIYEVKRNGITVLLPINEKPNKTDTIVKEYEVPEIAEEELNGLEDGDYIIRVENGEIKLVKVEDK